MTPVSPSNSFLAGRQLVFGGRYFVLTGRQLISAGQCFVLNITQLI
jgi:hypothetical protein